MSEQAEIVEEIAKHLGVTAADIDLTASLKDDLSLGPIEVADLLTDLSNKFQVTFDPIETDRLETVNDLVVLVEDLMLE